MWRRFWYRAWSTAGGIRDLRVSDVSGGVLTGLLFLTIALWPAMSRFSGSVTSIADWRKAMMISWPGLIAAVIVKIRERRKRTNTWDKAQRKRRRIRKVVAGEALRMLAASGRATRLSPIAQADLRHRLLQAAASSVESILSKDEQGVVANLLLFDTTDPNKMYVGGRSVLDRTTTQFYPRENLLAWKCIKTGQIEVIHDVKRDPMCDWMTDKNYKTIAAVPLTLDKKAFGAVTLDAERAYLFTGKVAEIALQVEPYVGAILLTIDPKVSSTVGCSYEPSGNR